MARKSKIQNNGPGNKPDEPNNAVRSKRSADEEYKVGPGRPPKEHQFKQGQSGNPKGAKRKAPSLMPDLKEIFERAFNKKLTVTQGERAQVITVWEYGIQQLAMQYAKGDRHARREAFYYAEMLGSSLLTPKAVDETLARDRQAILDAYVARQTQQKVSSASSPVLAPPELLDDDSPDEADKE